MENSAHVFKCALCGEIINTDSRPSRCPSCGAKAFVHVRGVSLRRKCGCNGSCSCCNGCH